jgi:hypothetical protein
MSKRRTNRSLKASDRALLQHVHAWGMGAARPLASILGLAYSTCTYRLRRLRKLGYIEPVGYARVPTTDSAMLLYYRPVLTKKMISEEFLPRRRHLDFSTPSRYQTSPGRFLPAHALSSFLHAEWVTFVLRHFGKSPRIIPEFILRFGLGWYGGGTPPRHPSPVIAMVPDFLLEVDQVGVHFEVELTVKKARVYEQQLLRLRPANRFVIYLVADDAIAGKLRMRLPQGRPNINVVTTGDDAALCDCLARAGVSGLL